MLKCSMCTTASEWTLFRWKYQTNEKVRWERSVLREDTGQRWADPASILGWGSTTEKSSEILLITQFSSSSLRENRPTTRLSSCVVPAEIHLDFNIPHASKLSFSKLPTVQQLILQETVTLKGLFCVLKIFGHNHDWIFALAITMNSFKCFWTEIECRAPRCFSHVSFYESFPVWNIPRGMYYSGTQNYINKRYSDLK